MVGSTELSANGLIQGASRQDLTTTWEWKLIGFVLIYWYTHVELSRPSCHCNISLHNLTYITCMSISTLSYSVHVQSHSYPTTGVQLGFTSCGFDPSSLPLRRPRCNPRNQSDIHRLGRSLECCRPRYGSTLGGTQRATGRPNGWGLPTCGHKLPWITCSISLIGFSAKFLKAWTIPKVNHDPSAVGA